MKTKISWARAYAYFISDENVSLKACAEKFELNYDSLRQKSSREGWVWKKEQVMRNTFTLMDSRTSEELVKIKETQLAFARALLEHAATAMRNGILPRNSKDIKEWIQAGVAIERLVLGLDKPDKKLHLKKQQQEYYQQFIGDSATLLS